MGRFETEILSQRENVKLLMSLPGKFVDKVHTHKRLNKLILDMYSSVSEKHEQQQGSAYNGHFSCNCFHPLFLFNQYGDVEYAMLRRGRNHSAKYWRKVLQPWYLKDIVTWIFHAFSEEMRHLQFPHCFAF